MNHGDEKYVSKVRQLAQGKNVRIEINRDFNAVKSELSTATHFWSANGYGRTDPAQVEHFGIVVLEAIASGAIPIVHKSGGAPDIDGAITWERPEELADLTLSNVSAPQLSEKFTLNHFKESVEKWLKYASMASPKASDPQPSRT
jgi:glycosyltransferase involved in cell wall biosynthesis